MFDELYINCEPFLTAARLIHTDHNSSITVDEWATAVPRIDGGVGLNHIWQWEPLNRFVATYVQPRNSIDMLFGGSDVACCEGILTEPLNDVLDRCG